jgi:hypothetical protein
MAELLTFRRFIPGYREKQRTESTTDTAWIEQQGSVISAFLIRQRTQTFRMPNAWLPYRSSGQFPLHGCVFPDIVLNTFIFHKGEHKPF